MLALMRFVGLVLTRSTLPRQAISRFTDGNKEQTSSRRVSRGLSVRPAYTAIPPVFLLILLLLSLFTNSIYADTAAQEIKFTGKALASCAEVTVTAVAVEVEDVILGPQPCMRMLVINIGSHLPGYVDRSIQKGDKVEVYGEYTLYSWKECSVSLSKSHHYIRKISGLGANESPTAQFAWQPISPEIGQTVLFTDQSYDPDGTIVDHSWTYGDGSFGAEPSHQYRQAGSYLVCLSVEDDAGDRNIACEKIQVRSHPTPPVDDGCSESTLVRGTVTAPPVTDSSSGYRYFFIRIAEVPHDTTGAVTVGELIQVRLSGSAVEALSEIAQGDYVEVCANWDSYLYCGELGYVRKVVPCLETDLLISEDDISVSETDPWVITATVHNIGENDARAVKVLFQHTVCPCDIIACGPGRSAEAIIDFIPKGGKAVARPVYTRPMPQTDTTQDDQITRNVGEWVTVIVDPHNVIPETNDDNNEARKTISVCEDERIDAEFVTDGWPEECQVSSGTYKPGDEVRADCRVKNTGSAQARFVVVFKARTPDGRIYSITSDPETILPGRRHTYLADQDNLLLTIPADAPGGSYDVRLEVQGYNTGKIYDVWPTSDWRNDQFKVTGELIPCADTVITGELISNSVVSPFRHFDLRIDEVIKNQNNIPTIVPGQNIFVFFSSALDRAVGSLQAGDCVKISGTWDENANQSIPGLRCDPDSCSEHSIEKITCPSTAEVLIHTNYQVLYVDCRYSEPRLEPLIVDIQVKDSSKKPIPNARVTISIPGVSAPIVRTNESGIARAIFPYQTSSGETMSYYPGIRNEALNLTVTAEFDEEEVTKNYIVPVLQFTSGRVEIAFRRTPEVIATVSSRIGVGNLVQRGTKLELEVGLRDFNVPLNSAKGVLDPVVFGHASQVFQVTTEGSSNVDTVIRTGFTYGKSVCPSCQFGEETTHRTYTMSASDFAKYKQATTFFVWIYFKDEYGDTHRIWERNNLFFADGILLPYGNHGLTEETLGVNYALMKITSYNVGLIGELGGISNLDSILALYDVLETPQPLMHVKATATLAKLTVVSGCSYMCGTFAPLCAIPCDAVFGTVLNVVFKEAVNREASSLLKQIGEDELSAIHTDPFSSRSLTQYEIYTIEAVELDDGIQINIPIFNIGDKRTVRVFAVSHDSSGIQIDEQDHIEALEPGDSHRISLTLEKGDSEMSYVVRITMQTRYHQEVLHPRGYLVGAAITNHIIGQKGDAIVAEACEGSSCPVYDIARQSEFKPGETVYLRSKILFRHIPFRPNPRKLSVILHAPDGSVIDQDELYHYDITTIGDIVTGKFSCLKCTSFGYSLNRYDGFPVGEWEEHVNRPSILKTGPIQFDYQWFGLPQGILRTLDCWWNIPEDAVGGKYEVVLVIIDEQGNIYDTVPRGLYSFQVGDQKNLQNKKMLITCSCPVDISTADPEGLVMSKSTNAIPEATYTEADLNGDGDPDDQIIIPNRKVGDYEIRVIPEDRAFPIDRYTLEVSDGFDTIVLADYVRVSDILEEPYVVKSSSEGISVVNESKPAILTPAPAPTPKPSPTQGGLGMLIAIIAGAVALVAIGIGVFFFLRSRYYI